MVNAAIINGSVQYTANPEKKERAGFSAKTLTALKISSLRIKNIIKLRKKRKAVL